MPDQTLKFGLRDMFLEGVKPLEQLFEFLKINGRQAQIDALTLKHKELNDLLKEAVLRGAREIEIKNVLGHRYIGTRLYIPGLESKVEINIHGTPGNDMAFLLNGHRITVYGNAQDGVANTMDDGEVVVHGRAGDIVAMSMRGGKVFIRDNVGYRAAIHMKEYMNKVPAVVIGGTAQDFFGEYMAGGIVLLLGLNLKENERHKAHYIGTGMHGGVIYLRGNVKQYQLGKQVGVYALDDKDMSLVRKYASEFSSHFGFNVEEILEGKFQKLMPVSLRPYGTLYAN